MTTPSIRASKRPHNDRDAFDDALYAAVARRTTRAKERGGEAGAVIVAGEVGAGKTAAALRLFQRLRSAGIRAGGVLAPRLVDQGKTVGYNVLDLSRGEDVPFARSEPPGLAVGRFYVRPEGLLFSERALRHAAASADVVVLDEVGRWELAGGGHAAAVRDVLASRAVAVLLVRSELIGAVAETFGLHDPDVLSVPQRAHRVGEGASFAFWSIVDSTPFPLLVTLGEDGYPQSRPMHLIAREGRTVWFPTSRHSRKVAHIAAHPEATVLFVDTDRFNYASLHGLAALDPNRDLASRLWRDDWRDDWPEGPRDPDFALLRVDGVRGYVLRGTTGESGEIDLAA